MSGTKAAHIAMNVLRREQGTKAKPAAGAKVAA
jgi:hypothetical protein